MARPLRHRVLPGFRLTLGYTWFYLGLVVLIPLSSLFLKTFSLSWEAFWSTVTTARALAAYRLSFGASLAAALANVVFGLLVAWVLVRYRFPGRDVLESLVDLPFALPTAVAGLTLTTLFSAKGWYGQHLEALGIQVAYTSVGVAVALTFIGLPFVVRAVQPVLEELDADVEEAAATLGASPWQTFRRVLFPALVPALLSGFTLAFARALGEYGSVVFISGNMPLRTEIVPLLIITRLEQYDYEGATAIAIVMLAASFSLLLAVNLLHRWSHRRWDARSGA
ncbi:sulfate ABC transporter permease subunit CysT [Comamonas sp. JC664]|uniref:sulfate ABC transporter permease subunit CysT n=1 Tax=Comamonas sp. JC664 TaxID=2801917 RepID=UPI00174C12CB|nr:sulfate ABC transporter permease subunit CysT [Comamonas sp. JC664]MBL0697190.1 sulfate ABC transporter permease subunit CysT [Comamonas sp. JC664]GHG83023.1 sulfate ABC transporter permease [Comamonas sp. KCTC 72670]